MNLSNLFVEDAHNLHLLAFLLTANHEKAEQCFVVGLDECLDVKPAVQKRSWARDIIVRNAIRIMAPHPNSAGSVQGPLHSSSEADFASIPLQDAQFASVIALEEFERFVYVLSVLEGYSDRNCAVLLSTSPREVRKIRIRVLQLGLSDPGAPFFAEAKLPSIKASLQSKCPFRFNSPRKVRQYPAAIRPQTTSALVLAQSGKQRLYLSPLPIGQQRTASWHLFFLLPPYRPLPTPTPSTSVDPESGYETASRSSTG